MVQYWDEDRVNIGMRHIQSAVSVKVLEKEVVVNATPAQLFQTWTTEAGLKSFFSEQVNFRLEEGGPFEILFDMSQPEGLRGSEGCKVVNWEDDVSIAFTWNFPPSLPQIRNERTIVKVTFEALEKGESRVTLVQSGWQDHGEWVDGFTYFERAWGMVLESLRNHFS